MLTLEKCLFSSHEDFSNYATLTAGYDDKLNFIVELVYDNTDYPNENFSKRMKISKHDAYRVAQRKDTDLTALPEWFCTEFAAGGHNDAQIREMEQTFYKIRQYIAEIPGIRIRTSTWRAGNK